MTTRYAQMSYTSFDSAGSAGGWRGKQTSGDLADPQQTLLLSCVHTGLNAVKPIPPYPTLEQLQQIPRRLAYRRVNRDNGCYWHTVPAGADHTGRPGNVFIHALLDRAARAADAPYPADRTLAVAAVALPLRPDGGGPRRAACRSAGARRGGDPGQRRRVRLRHRHVAAGHAVRFARRGRGGHRRRPARR